MLLQLLRTNISQISEKQKKKKIKARLELDRTVTFLGTVHLILPPSVKLPFILHLGK